MINVMTRLLGVFLFFASFWIAGPAQATATNCAAIASGGTISSISVGSTSYCLHTFTNTGAQSFSVIDPNVFSSAPLSLEYLVVGGGGGGDSGICNKHWGSGGGGGQVLQGSVSVSNTNPLSVVVGAGGTRGGNLDCNNVQVGGQPGAGGNSAFGAVTANGGGPAVHGGSVARGGHSGNGLYLGTAATAGPSTPNGFRGGAGAGDGAASTDGYVGGSGSTSSITGTSTYYGGAVQRQKTAQAMLAVWVAGVPVPMRRLQVRPIRGVVVAAVAPRHPLGAQVVLGLLSSAMPMWMRCAPYQPCPINQRL